MKKRAYSLDAFRVLAIFGVFLSHLSFYNDGLPGDATLISGTVLSAGGIAAHFFILLSAFMVAYSFDRSISVGYAEYIRKRARRLLPLNMFLIPFYVIVLFIMGLNNFSWLDIIAKVILSSFLIQELLHFSSMCLNAPAWTISTLFILYFITPWLMRPLQRIRQPWVLVLLVVVLMFADIEYRNWLASLKPHNSWINYASPINRLVSYVEGLTLGYAARVVTCPEWLRCRATWLELPVFGAVVYGCLIMGSNIDVSYRLLLYSMPPLIALCYMEAGAVSRAVARSFVSKMSPYVYAFYLVHYLCLCVSVIVCQRILGIWTHMSMLQLSVTVAVTSFCACVLSVVLHHCVEKRFA